MRLWRGMTAVVLATAVLWSIAVLAQPQMTLAGCDAVRVPLKVEGKVVKVSKEQGKVTVQTSDGITHEFQADKETLQDLKAGSPIAMKLRRAPDNC
jgi:hypothetical protein